MIFIALQGPIALRSAVWNHFKEKVGDKTTVKCDHCPKIFKFSSSTTGIKNHLKSAHFMKDVGNEASSGQGELTNTHSQMSIKDSMLKQPPKMPYDEVKKNLS